MGSLRDGVMNLEPEISSDEIVSQVVDPYPMASRQYGTNIHTGPRWNSTSSVSRENRQSGQFVNYRKPIYFRRIGDNQ